MTWTKAEHEKIDALAERIGEMSERFAVVADRVEHHETTLYQSETGLCPRLAAVHIRQADCLKRRPARFTSILTIIGLILILLGLIVSILLHFCPRPRPASKPQPVTQAK